jgi:protein involved in polysaccharide export with SLBB domain
MPSAILDRPVARAVAGVALGVALAAPARAQAPGPGTAAAPDSAAAGAQSVAAIPPARWATPDTIERPVGVLRPGDQLKIAVYRDKELSGDYLIDAQGFVQIPGVGVVRAAGLDPTQVHDQIIRALLARGFATPEVAVQPLMRVSVLGEVRQPGLRPVDPGTSLLQLVTLAGGPTDQADLRHTRVIREGRAFNVDLESALRGSASGRVVLYSNDVVVIGKRRGITRDALVVGTSVLTSLITIATFFISLAKR